MKDYMRLVKRIGDDPYAMMKDMAKALGGEVKMVGEKPTRCHSLVRPVGEDGTETFPFVRCLKCREIFVLLDDDADCDCVTNVEAEEAPVNIDEETEEDEEEADSITPPAIDKPQWLPATVGGVAIDYHKHILSRPFGVEPRPCDGCTSDNETTGEIDYEDSQGQKHTLGFCSYCYARKNDVIALLKQGKRVYRS